jgi:hypothetical protein
MVDRMNILSKHFFIAPEYLYYTFYVNLHFENLNNKEVTI